MFGIGFFEILIILIVAVIFLGPERLPQAIVDFVKFFRAVKKTINEAKDTLDKELEISKLTNEVSDIKSQFETNIDSITKDMDLSNLQEIKEIKEEMQDLGRLQSVDNVEDLENLDKKLGTKENLFSEYSSLPQTRKTTKSNQTSNKLAKNTNKSPAKSNTKSTTNIKSAKSSAKSTPQTKQAKQTQKNTKSPKSTKSKTQKSSPNNAYEAL